mmetsp:Transcript_22370/g.63472  ORF Transcript_22370/g.63472 Transcript_22370/m.63472 type:complete len:280 (+) Transcript_22370:471-1310(+)
MAVVPCVQAVRLAPQHAVPAEFLSAAATPGDLGEGPPGRGCQGADAGHGALQRVLVGLAGVVLQEAQLDLDALERGVGPPDPRGPAAPAVPVEVDEPSRREEPHVAKGLRLRRVLVAAGHGEEGVPGEVLLLHVHAAWLLAGEVLQDALEGRGRVGPLRRGGRRGRRRRRGGLVRGSAGGAAPSAAPSLQLHQVLDVLQRLEVLLRKGPKLVVPPFQLCTKLLDRLEAKARDDVIAIDDGGDKAFTKATQACVAAGGHRVADSSHRCRPGHTVLPQTHE